MPKTDPVTGCSVLTLGEFWQREAEHEGKGRDPWELENEFFDQLELDNQKIRKELLDRDRALDTIKRMLTENTDDERDIRMSYGFTASDIVECIDVLDSDANQSFRDFSNEFVARVSLRDGSARDVKYSAWHSYGSRLDPPDFDESLTVVRINDDPVVNQFNDNCAHIYDKKHSLPICEICEKFGGGALHGMKNPVRYLMPASYDRGKTITRWVRVCVAHERNWYVGAGWRGPKIELRQKEPAPEFV